MIKIEVKGHEVKADIHGTIVEITTDIMSIICSIYNKLDSKYSEAFKEAVKGAVADDVPFGKYDEKPRTIMDKIQDDADEFFDFCADFFDKLRKERGKNNDKGRKD